MVYPIQLNLSENRFSQDRTNVDFRSREFIALRNLSTEPAPWQITP